MTLSWGGLSIAGLLASISFSVVSTSKKDGNCDWFWFTSHATGSHLFCCVEKQLPGSIHSFKKLENSIIEIRIRSNVTHYDCLFGNSEDERMEATMDFGFELGLNYIHDTCIYNDFKSLSTWIFLLFELLLNSGK